MHRLLDRQLRRHFAAAVPPGLEAFLEDISRTYEANDADRGLLERSLELSSAEMLQLNDELRRQVAAAKVREAQLAEANARLEEVDSERVRFLNTAAHELATPLTPLKLQVRLVGDRARLHPGKDLHSFEILERNVERLARLVQDLLDAARLQSPEMRLEPKDVDLADEAIAAVDTYREIAEAVGVQVEVEDLPPMPVRCDPARLSQVFDNLLSNGVKFTPPGGTVRVTGRLEARHCRISVADNGPGIPAGKRHLLWRPFSRVHDDRTPVPEGTGLGLFITKGIVERAGGAVEYAPRPGGGSVFTVTLPLRPSAPGA